MNWEELLSKVSIKSILELPVNSKDNQTKNIYFDFYGFEAILPLDEIANEYGLKHTLFHTIKIGELINLVLINIDTVNQRFTFSTRVFRTALNDILSFTKCKLIVEKNREDHLGIPSKFIIQHRNQLDRLRGDLSSNELTFLYELIQNAVDHSNRNFDFNVNITFEVFNNYLLVKHNGALFTENNFESITGILYGEQQQESEKGRIGYKGIGFKSVFRFTENAYVRSGNFSFRFSKIESGKEKPWEVLPIFQIEKDMVNKIPQFDFFNSPVAFAFEFNNEKNKNDVIKYLNLLSQNPYLLIFLENLSQIKIKAPSVAYTENGLNVYLPPLDISFRKDLNDIGKFKSIELVVNNKLHSEWLTYTKNDIIIQDEEVINELLDETETAVPAKMRTFRSPQITIALPKTTLNDDVINLFAYLPLSNTKFKLPFLVNADFIPDLDRTDIIHNLKYNNEVLRLLAVSLKEFAQELADGNDLENLNRLLPDFNFEYPNAARVFIESLFKLLPSTSLIVGDQRIELANIIIDRTSFLSNFGKSDFENLIGGGYFGVNHLGSYDRIEKLIESINSDAIFNFSKLKKIVSLNHFESWLKNEANNLNFIEYLNRFKQLDYFKEEAVFLSEDFNLFKGDELYTDLDEDFDSLNWLDYKKVLNRSISNELFDISLPLKKYVPINFINNVICHEKKDYIIHSLLSGLIKFEEFYSYLSKYSSYSSFPYQNIKGFPLKTNQGVLNDWSSPIYFNSKSLEILLSNKSLPSNSFSLLEENWDNTDQFLLGKLLGAQEFSDLEPFNFTQSVIVFNYEKIKSFYLTDPSPSIESNAAFWYFILASFENLSSIQIDSIKSTIKQIPVFSKSKKYDSINNLFLSSEYTDDESLERLMLQFPNSNISFVSGDYLLYPAIEKGKIKKLFKLLDVKDDSIDFLKYTLIPNLNLLDDELLLPLTKLIYENREIEEIIFQVLNSPYFKIKTKEGNFRPIKDCILGSPYIDDFSHQNTLGIIKVENQVSEEYSNKNFDSWRKFFNEKLELPQLNVESEIISLKLKSVNDNLDYWKIPSNSVRLFDELNKLYKAGRLSLNGINLSLLKNIPLLVKGENDDFVLPNLIHFSSAYNPIFDFEELVGLDNEILFLSEKYIIDGAKDILLLFEQIGVTQVFERGRLGAFLKQIPTLDGKYKPANQLFKYEFVKVVGPGNVSIVDFSNFSYEGKTIEDYFDFIPRLDVLSILNYISVHKPSRRELKELIIQFHLDFGPNSYNDRLHLNNFISKGSLLSTAKTYNLVANLYAIDESINSGIRESEYIIDPLFTRQDQENKVNKNKYLNRFGIKTLKLEDFNPQFEEQKDDFEFLKRVNERLVFLAFDIDNEKYLEIEEEYKEKLKEWKIKKCRKISLKYPSTESKIVKDDNRNFIIEETKTIFYIGDWFELRNYILVEWLQNQILDVKKQLQFLQDILLNSPIDIISDFEIKGKNVPDELKNRFIFKRQILQPDQIKEEIPIIELNDHSTSDISQIVEDSSIKEIKEIVDIIPDVTSEDEEFIRSIINFNYEKDGQIDANTTAKIKTLMEIRLNYQLEEISDEGRFLKAGNDEILVRSAQNGLLYFDLYSWDRLSDSKVQLALYTNGVVSFYKTPEDLISYTKPLNKFGVLRMPEDYALDDYNLNKNTFDKGKWHFVLIVNENTNAAKNYNDIMNLEDYNF